MAAENKQTNRKPPRNYVNRTATDDRTRPNHETMYQCGRPHLLHANLRERLGNMDLIQHDGRVWTKRRRRYKMRQTTFRNTRPSSTGDDCSISVSSLTLCACRGSENVNSWIIRVLDADITTASGENRTLRIWHAVLRGRINSRPKRASAKRFATILSMCDACRQKNCNNTVDVWHYTTVIRVR